MEFIYCTIIITYLTKVAISCPENWIPIDTSCYRIYNYPVNYYQAQSFCQSQQESSYMADISTDLELQYWKTVNII